MSHFTPLVQPVPDKHPMVYPETSNLIQKTKFCQLSLIDLPDLQQYTRCLLTHHCLITFLLGSEYSHWPRIRVLHGDYVFSSLFQTG
jgi:hypothetical protein